MRHPEMTGPSANSQNGEISVAASENPTTPQPATITRSSRRRTSGFASGPSNFSIAQRPQSSGAKTAETFAGSLGSRLMRW
ncbi:MAG: hypothetical protein IPK32_15905 [Verrucomicrobiaceae bacterium]|nr:hypothetical protein [Verrucomicrobiaceae bacterium]